MTRQRSLRQLSTSGAQASPSSREPGERRCGSLPRRTPPGLPRSVGRADRRGRVSCHIDLMRPSELVHLTHGGGGRTHFAAHIPVGGDITSARAYALETLDEIDIDGLATCTRSATVGREPSRAQAASSSSGRGRRCVSWPWRARGAAHPAVAIVGWAVSSSARTRSASSRARSC